MTPSTRVRLDENQPPMRHHRERVRLTDWEHYLDLADWKKLDALRPLPLGWKGRPGLMFPWLLRTNPRWFYLTTKQTAEFLGMEDKTLHNWRRMMKGPKPTSVGLRSVRYNVADLLEWLMEQRKKERAQ